MKASYICKFVFANSENLSQAGFDIHNNDIKRATRDGRVSLEELERILRVQASQLAVQERRMREQEERLTRLERRESEERQKLEEGLNGISKGTFM